MAISQDDRERFQQIGRDQLATALATGRLQSLEITEDKKPAAMEWVREQDAERDAAHAAEMSMQRSTLRCLAGAEQACDAHMLRHARGMSWRMPATTPARCKPTWGIETFRTQLATLR